MGVVLHPIIVAWLFDAVDGSSRLGDVCQILMRSVVDLGPQWRGAVEQAILDTDAGDGWPRSRNAVDKGRGDVAPSRPRAVGRNLCLRPRVGARRLVTLIA